MDMSSYVVGVRDLDGKFKKMMRVKRACEDAGVGYPQDLCDYLPYEPEESESLFTEEMESIDLDGIIKEGGDGHRQWLELDVDKIPDEAKKIRFYHSG